MKKVISILGILFLILVVSIFFNELSLMIELNTMVLPSISELIIIFLIITVLLFTSSKKIFFQSHSINDKGDDMNTENNMLLRTIPVNDIDNVVTKINQKRDEIYNLIEKVSKELEVSIKCIKSSSIDTSTWVTCSVSNNEDTYKSKDANVIIVIESKPFHEYDVIIGLEINTSNYQKTFEKIIEFNENDIKEILEILISENGKIKYKPKRYSDSTMIFWREKNKLIKKYDEEFDIFKVFPLNLLFLPIIILIEIAKGIYTLINGRKSYFKVSMGRPNYEPRDLAKLDSWQTVIMQIASKKEALINELQVKLSQLNIDEENFSVEIEKIWYWGVNGKEEREQLACIFKRGYVFVHIYAYGDDLYVGWDANLNYATWEEYKVSDGYTNGSVRNIELFSIRPTWNQVNEYDLDDTNFLLETVHTYLIQSIKRIMKENEIDQEIDFSIVRESRKDVLNAEKPKKDHRSKFKRLS